MRYAWLLLFAIGCYSAPDYGGTHFKCDVDHDCPPGQACVNNVCGGSGSGSNMPDAAAPDFGVQCGSTVCSASQKCCASFTGSPSCIAQSASCAGEAATCDGIEDCNGGVCCDVGGQAIACATSCSQQICRDNTDCGGTSPLCCPSIGTNEPWGRCLPICP